MPNDIPIQNGPAANELPDWACSTLSCLHKAMADIYSSLLMPEIAEMHYAESQRIVTLETSTASLAKQIVEGFQPGQFRYPICSSGNSFIKDFDERCKLCGSKDPKYCWSKVPFLGYPKP